MGGTYSELEGLDETDHLLHAAADRRVVDGHLAKDTLGVDEVGRAEREALLLEQAAVVGRDLVVLVRDERDSERRALAIGLRAKTAERARRGSPLEVSELAVGRDTKDGSVQRLESREGSVEGKDLRRADEGEVPEQKMLEKSDEVAKRSLITWGRRRG